MKITYESLSSLYSLFSSRSLESIMLLLYRALLTCAPFDAFCTSTSKASLPISSALMSSRTPFPPTLELFILYSPLTCFTLISVLPSIVRSRYSVASIFSSNTLLISSSLKSVSLSMILSISLFTFPIPCPPFGLISRRRAVYGFLAADLL